MSNNDPNRPHCWHRLDALNLTHPPSRKEACCWCGAGRTVRLVGHRPEGHGTALSEALVREWREEAVGGEGPCPGREEA